MNAGKVIAILLLLMCAFPKVQIIGKEKADYVVIGVGTSGATIAKLLSDNKENSVIALHNGKDLQNDPDIKFTKNAAFTVFSALLGSPLYQTGFSTPQPNANDREIFWTLAVPEGGASSINAGAWCRGTNQVYSQWEAIAGPEWSVNKIQVLYKNLENYNGVTTDPAVRGFNGPINVRQNPTPTPFSLKFNQAVSSAVGVPIVVDYNDPNTPIGASTQVQSTQRGENGQFRVSSATAFLNETVVTQKGKGVNGRKLRIRFKSTALETIWEGNKAVGVKYYRNGKIKKAFATKGVIVCAGLYSSAFLMHSGVGSKELLTPLGIPVKFDNPNVGQGLADQPNVIIAFSTNPKDTPISGSCDVSGKLPSGLSAGVLEPSYFFRIPNLPDQKQKDQLLNAFLCDGFAFPGNSIFAQISWLPAPGGDPTIRKIRIAPVNPIPGLAIAFIDLVQPQSRGRITIDGNPLNPPILDAGEFSVSADLDLYVRTFQTYIKNINDALHEMDAAYNIILPDPSIINDVTLLTEFIKEQVGSNQVWQSHCRMAPFDQGGVVDSTGKVYGVQNLYVADNSVNPVAMDGTPMATGYLVAANIARLLLQQ